MSDQSKNINTSAAKEVQEDTRHGRQMTDEELKEYYEAFQLVEDSIEGLEDEEED